MIVLIQLHLDEKFYTSPLYGCQ